MSGCNTCSTSTVGPWAARTSGSRRYTWGLSSAPPPRSTTPFRSTHSSIISREMAPGFVTLPRRVRFPAAAVRLITRPDPCRAAHHPTRAVHRRVQRARLQVPHLGRVRRDALDDHRVITHGASHEPFLAGKGRRRTLAHDIEGLPAVLLTPGEVVMVVNQLLLPPAEQLDHFARDPFAPGVGVASGQVHELPVGVPHRARDVEQRLTLRHALAPRAVLPERKKAVRHAEPEPARAEVHADPDAVDRK